MIDDFLVLGSGDPRPDAERVVFCDGSGGDRFRAQTDLELSHWRPNCTPPQYRADTSTEICYRFLDDPLPGDWTLAVNNHLDVDGILSLYVLLHPSHSLAHRRTIVEAAEMGDFWGWGEPPAQRLFQGLTLLMNERRASGVAPVSIYRDAFERVPGLIEGSDPHTESIDESLEPLRRGAALIESGEILRRPHRQRFVQYLIPRMVTEGSLDQALYVPGFNEAISANALLWPQARARRDGERVCLVSVESPEGWYHDVWYPGYLWADTADRWTGAGLVFRDGMQEYDLQNPMLMDALRALQAVETAAGTWAVADRVSPFHAELQSIFPVVARFANESGGATPSRLPPADVAAHLSSAFD